MLIGILGNSGSGKDVFADHLVKKYRFKKVALADPLKRICKDVYRFTDKQLWGPSEERNKTDTRYRLKDGGYLTPRKALQTLGTEWGRMMYEDTWVDKAIDVSNQILFNGCTYDAKTGLRKRSALYNLINAVPAGVVFSDIRFRNEINKIHMYDGIVIRLKRPGVTGRISGGVGNHASEMEQMDILDEEVELVMKVPDGLLSFKAAIDELYPKIENKFKSRFTAGLPG